MKKSDYKQWAHTLTPAPCPFCGKAPKIFPLRPQDDGDCWGAVACHNLRCPANPQVNDGCSVNDMRGPGAYKDLAIKRWNRRPK